MQKKIKLEIKDFGIANLSVAPIRAAASDESEIVTQILFGDLVTIIEKGQPWIHVRLEGENYEGWMDFKQLSYLDQDEFNTLKNGDVTYVQDPLLPMVGPRGQQNVMLGAALRNLNGKDLIYGHEIYTLNQLPNQFDTDLITTSKAYLNTPYLWGGKSIFGIDCSGLIQNVFKVFGTLLPRDASQQVFEGEAIDFEDRQPGDVPFFINSKGKVHHVGILTNSNTIVHAAGCVREDPFDEKGIYREDLDTYTHHYHSIRRY